MAPMYSAALLDHFENPRNPGAVPSPDACAQLENPACGDVLELTAKVSNGVIVEVGFRAKGCVPAMACASAITELVKGKGVSAALNLRREELVEKLGELPPTSAHASHLAMETLKLLLKSFEQ